MRQFASGSVPPSATVASVDWASLVKSLQCGDSIVTILPSLLYFVGIGLLVHHIIVMNIRPQLYRRVGRELIVQIPWQEILILMLFYQCVKLWMALLQFVNIIFANYRMRMAWYERMPQRNVGPETYQTLLVDFCKIPLVLTHLMFGFPSLMSVQVSNVKELHSAVQRLIRPNNVQFSICIFFAALPLVALLKLRERRPLPQFMLWLGPVRRERSEFGTSGYYLERPAPLDPTPPVGLERVSKSSSVTGGLWSRAQPPRHATGHHRCRARKSLSV